MSRDFSSKALLDMTRLPYTGSGMLGSAVANLINILNPEMVVIAGGVTRAGDHLFVPLRAEVRRRAFKSAEERCQIVSAELPGTAGVIGAAGVFKKETYGKV